MNWERITPLESSDMHEQRMIRDLARGNVQQSRKDGNVDAAFAKAKKIVERTYSSPFMAHNTMEPMNFFADVKENAVELIGPSQTPQALRESVSKMLGIDAENISVNMTRMGGVLEEDFTTILV